MYYELDSHALSALMVMDIGTVSLLCFSETGSGCRDGGRGGGDFASEQWNKVSLRFVVACGEALWHTLDTHDL